MHYASVILKFIFKILTFISEYALKIYAPVFKSIAFLLSCVGIFIYFWYERDGKRYYNLVDLWRNHPLGNYNYTELMLTVNKTVYEIKNAYFNY